jgi:hypothetical protein
MVAAADAHLVRGARHVEYIVETFVCEIALLLGDPFLETVVRLDLEW